MKEYVVTGWQAQEPQSTCCPLNHAKDDVFWLWLLVAFWVFILILGSHWAGSSEARRNAIQDAVTHPARVQAANEIMHRYDVSAVEAYRMAGPKKAD